MEPFWRVKDQLKILMAEGDGDQHGQEREDEGGVVRDAHDEHVVGPDKEAEEGDGDRREGDGRVAEDAACG